MGKPNDGATNQYAPPPPGPPQGHRPHENEFSRAAAIRAIDEVQMSNLLMTAQRHIEPEHETEWYCTCATCEYRRQKFQRKKTHQIWSQAVKYPGEKTYNDLVGSAMYSGGAFGTAFSGNPCKFGTLRVSDSGLISLFRQILPKSLRLTDRNGLEALQLITSLVRVFPLILAILYLTQDQELGPTPNYHEQNIHGTIDLNNKLNKEAQAAIDAMEPKVGIWDTPATAGQPQALYADKKKDGKATQYAPPPGAPSSAEPSASTSKSSKRSSGFFAKLLGPKTPKPPSGMKHIDELGPTIIEEEQSRWPNIETRQIVMIYQEKVGMSKKIADLRARSPIQYLHLLRAGYFEPIPTHWSDQASNPLKFTIEAAGGWRGITPAWRGYEDTAEERLYWVLNHREGISTMRMKPDFISEMTMARDRMARAVAPPPEYFDPLDQCHLQHTSEGYSKQVLPPTFRPYDREEIPSDDTMILLDVSGSMDFDPLRPKYDRYMITGYEASTQPRNKDVAKAIVRRFTHAMAKHDHLRAESGYDLVTFSTHAAYAGRVSDETFENVWKNVKVGGGTRVMTGWQKVKELHFKKHHESAVHHPVFGWQAGPETPMLRLLLLLDGEATDMDEFELDLLGLSWAHVTIFLIGVDGCPHHHRHANELQRISDVNHHVNFVDAQGNTPERFVTHELLKRHLGNDNIALSSLSFAHPIFTELEDLPAYAAVV
ncbi:hypothetical protein P7C70_g1143, partial [Phenoliferia sp. Uapishka_3]